MDSSQQVESSLDVDENIVCTSVQKEVNLSILHPKEEKEATKLFHINIWVKNSKINALFDFSSQENPIANDLIHKIVLELHEHPSPYPFGWVNNDA